MRCDILIEWSVTGCTTHVLYRAAVSDNMCLVVLLTAFVMFSHVLLCLYMTKLKVCKCIRLACRVPSPTVLKQVLGLPTVYALTNLSINSLTFNWTFWLTAVGLQYINSIRSVIPMHIGPLVLKCNFTWFHLSLSLQISSWHSLNSVTTRDYVEITKKCLFTVVKLAEVILRFLYCLVPLSLRYYIT